ncbi:MAG: SDR family oxidoreductase [Pseudomonadota bacterium]
MTTHNDFSGRSALVTGAASGIGAACAQLLAERGAAKLILVDVDEAGMAALDLGDTETARIKGSVADEPLWSEIAPHLAGLNHAIVNAGMGGFGAFSDLAMEDWRRIMDVNLDGAFLTLRASLRAMLEARKDGNSQPASIVITASSTGIKPVPGTGPYGVSKAAVAHMARMAAAENAGAGIRVNAIAPGGVDTAIWESGPDFNEAVAKYGREAVIGKMAKTTPLGRFSTARETAQSILFMLSDEAPNLTGHVLVDDGGFTL